MDYSKSGAPKKGRNSPRHDERNQGPNAARTDKSDLIARMKKAQGHPMSDDKTDDSKSKKPADIEGQSLDRPNDGAGKIAIDEVNKKIRGREDIDGEKNG